MAKKSRHTYASDRERLISAALDRADDLATAQEMITTLCTMLAASLSSTLASKAVSVAWGHGDLQEFLERTVA